MIVVFKVKESSWLKLLHYWVWDVKNICIPYFQLVSDQIFFPPLICCRCRDAFKGHSVHLVCLHVSSLCCGFSRQEVGKLLVGPHLGSALRSALPLLQLTLQTTQIHTQSLNPIHRCRPCCFTACLQSYSIK